MTESEKKECIPFLKDCPFCGNKSEFREVPGNYGYDNGQIYILCPLCRIKTNSEDTEEWKSGRGTYSIKQEAMNKLANLWNKRQSPSG